MTRAATFESRSVQSSRVEARSTAFYDCLTTCSTPKSSRDCPVTQSSCCSMPLRSSRAQTTATSISPGVGYLSAAGPARAQRIGPSMNSWRPGSSAARAKGGSIDARSSHYLGSPSIHATRCSLKLLLSVWPHISGENRALKIGAHYSHYRSNQAIRRGQKMVIDLITGAVSAFSSTQLLLKQHTFLDIPRAESVLRVNEAIGPRLLTANGPSRLSAAANKQTADIVPSVPSNVSPAYPAEPEMSAPKVRAFRTAAGGTGFPLPSQARAPANKSGALRGALRFPTPSRACARANRFAAAPLLRPRVRRLQAMANVGRDSQGKRIMRPVRAGANDSGPALPIWAAAYLEKHRRLPAGMRVTCGGRRRCDGQPCTALSVPGKRRCKWHGGCSTGPRTSEGKAKVTANLPRIGNKVDQTRN